MQWLNSGTFFSFIRFHWVILCLSFSVNGHDFQVKENWLTPPDGLDYIGNSHGEIAVASNGEVYVSVMGEKGGIQVYSDKGKFLRNIPNAPQDIHGFVIKKDHTGQEVIYGAEMNGKRTFKLALDGQRLLDIDAMSAIPEKFHRPQIANQKGWVPAPLRLTAADIASNGDIYVVDGYGMDYIHQFDKKGQYITTFAGKNAPWNFSNCHKIAIDPRYQPNRIICTDRANGRLVHMKLNGELIGDYATGLLRPSAVDFYQDYVAVAEITGRVTILDKAANVVKHLGTNTVRAETDKNKTPPEKWRVGVFTSPHGISFDTNGNLFITEYNQWGRVLRFDAVLKH